MSCKLLLQKLLILTPRLANSYVQRCQTSVPDIFENSRNTRYKGQAVEDSEKSRLLMSDLSDWVVTKSCQLPRSKLSTRRSIRTNCQKRAIYRVKHCAENFEEEKNYIEINTNTVENTATWWPGRCMRRIAVAGIEGK